MDTIMNTKSKESTTTRSGWLYLLLILLFGIMVYRDALMPGHVIFTTDDNVGAIADRKSTLPYAFMGGWLDSLAVGLPNNVPVNLTNLLLAVMSPRLFVNWIHTIDLVVGSWFFMLYLRLRGMQWISSLLGALLTFWLGSTFFLTYAGHIGKFGVVMCAGIYLYCIEKAIRERSVNYAVLAGAAMAGMFLEQSDSALFFATVLGPYAVFRCWQAFRMEWKSYLRILVPVGVATAMIGFNAVYAAYSFYRIESSDNAADTQSAQELWDYCTQWSWPPSETIEFIAPGYMGWRTGEPSGPYWGALGRSAQWQPQFGPNGMNFKLETFYKGILPMLFLALGFYHSLVRRRDDKDQRQVMVFWTLALVVTFVLACGKYTPLYRLFFMLPGVSSIRNPVKFMQITQFAMGFLAAAGLDYWLRWMMNRGTLKQDVDKPVLASFTRYVMYTAIALTLFAVLLFAQQGGAAAEFASQGWMDMGQVIAANRASALLHAALIAWIAYGLLRLGFSSGSIKHTSWVHLGGAVIAVVMVDQLMISRRYVQSVETNSLVSEGALIPYLQQNLEHQRAYLWNPPPNMQNQWGGIYNQWMTILFPYHQVPLLNVAQMRMSDDYKAFFETFGPRPVQMWALAGLKYALTPAEFWMQVRNDPSLRGAFEPVAGFNITKAGKNGVTTVQSMGQQPAQHVLLRFLRPSDRFTLVTAWKPMEWRDAITELTRIDPLTEVMVDPEKSADWPASGQPGRTGEVHVNSYRPGRFDLQIRTDRAAVLRVSEKYFPDWRAWVDGVEKPVVRTDGIFLGVLVTPSDGPQNVVLAFQPQRTTFYLQMAGLAIAVLSFSCLAISGLRAHKPLP